MILAFRSLSAFLSFSPAVRLFSLFFLWDISKFRDTITYTQFQVVPMTEEERILSGQKSSDLLPCCSCYLGLAPPLHFSSFPLKKLNVCVFPLTCTPRERTSPTVRLRKRKRKTNLLQQMSHSTAAHFFL